MERESMAFDVVIVGAGPAGLSAAIRLRQRAAEGGPDLSVCVIEKGSEVGAHILSGAVLEPHALNELIADWAEKGAPLNTPVKDDNFLILRRGGGAIPIPHALLPKTLGNHGNYIISLSDFCRWLGEQAEALGVEIYPGFAAAEILKDEQGAVCGVATGDMGLGRDGQPGPNHQPGMELHAKYTLLAEGCRGHLGKQLMAAYDLRDGVAPQTYGIGIKELWEIPADQHRAGVVLHSVGWPLESRTYGGGFLYHLADNRVALGFVIGLDYENPHLSPFDEMQRYKTHPKIRAHIEGGRRIGYGARALNEGGWQSLPRGAFPGGLLIGCEAGTLNMPKIKGSHTAMKSGMIAADVVADHLAASDQGGARLDAYDAALRASWVGDELKAARNVRPGFKWGLWGGLLHAGFDQIVMRGKAPWTLKHGHVDHESLKRADQAPKIAYPKPDGVLTFDKLSSVFLSNTNHEEDQPVHLRLTDNATPITVNLALYDEPAQRYCPAGVYEIVEEAGDAQLRINAQNCVHCKTCDIKDPTQNITWVTPEGGGGPNYSGM